MMIKDEDEELEAWSDTNEEGERARKHLNGKRKEKVVHKVKDEWDQEYDRGKVKKVRKRSCKTWDKGQTQFEQIVERKLK